MPLETLVYSMSLDDVLNLVYLQVGLRREIGGCSLNHDGPAHHKESFCKRLGDRPREAMSAGFDSKWRSAYY